MATREMTIEFQGRAAASVKQASEQARRAIGGVGDETEQSSKKTRGGLTKMGAAAASFAGNLGADLVGKAAGAVKDFVGQSITASSDMQETLSKSRAIFGPLAGDMEKWAAGAPKAFGLAQAEALKYSAGLGDMTRQIGFSEKASADFSKDIVQMSGDLGSFSNLETGDVLERISAALRGEYDSLQAVIPNINAARVEQEALAASGKKTAKELTAQDKALAVQAILHKDGARAMGDFAKTSDGFANQQKIAAAQVEDLQAKLGNALLPILTAVMTFITSTAIPAVSEFADWFGAELGPKIAEFGTHLQGLLPMVQKFGDFLAQNAEWLLPIAGIIAAVVAAIKVWTVVQAALNLVMAANPIGIVVIAIAALVAGLIYAYQNSETFRNIVNAVFTKVKQVVLNVVTAVIGAVRGIGDWLTRTQKTAVEFVARVIRAFHEANRRIIDTVSGLVRGVLRFFSDLRNRALSFVIGLTVGAIRSVIKFRDDFVRGVQILRDRAVGFVRDLRDRAVGTVYNLRDRFVAGVVSLRDRAVRFALSLRDRFVAFIVSLRDRAARIASQIRDWIANRVGGLRDRVVRLATSIRDRVLAPFRLLRDKGREIFASLRDGVGKIMSGLLDKVKGPLREVFSWLNRNLIKPLNSVTSKFGLTIPELPKFHSGTSRVGRGRREIPAILRADEAVLTGRAADMLGRGMIDKLNRGESFGGPGDWIKDFTEFISRPAQLVAEMAKNGVKWAVNQVLGAIPNVPSTGVPMADVVPGILRELRSKIKSWASDTESEQQQALGNASAGAIGTGPWVKPVGASVGTGYLGYPGHYGVDFPAGTGTPVHAVSNAIVSKAAALNYSYGRHLFLRHADGLVTVYAHLSQMLANVGQQVKTGQVIGRVGSTGNSTGPHLHFETRVGGGYPGPNPRSVMAARGVRFDSGGMLPPGLSAVFNGTGGPEPVLTGDQWSTLTKPKDTGPQIVINIDGALDPDAVARQVINLLDRYDRNRGGVQVNRKVR